MAIHDWYDRHRGTITYSMEGSRNGTDGTADCSGSISQALKDAKYAISGLPSTVSLGYQLQRMGFTRIHTWTFGQLDEGWTSKTDDIIQFSWGPGMAYSGGAGGHVGIMHDPNTFESTDYWTGGQENTAISSHNIDDYLMSKINDGLKYYEVWRQINDSPPENAEGAGEENTQTEEEGENNMLILKVDSSEDIWMFDELGMVKLIPTEWQAMSSLGYKTVTEQAFQAARALWKDKLNRVWGPGKYRDDWSDVVGGKS